MPSEMMSVLQQAGATTRAQAALVAPDAPTRSEGRPARLLAETSLQSLMPGLCVGVCLDLRLLGRWRRYVVLHPDAKVKETLRSIDHLDVFYEGNGQVARALALGIPLARSLTDPIEGRDEPPAGAQFADCKSFWAAAETQDGRAHIAGFLPLMAPSGLTRGAVVLLGKPEHAPKGAAASIAQLNAAQKSLNHTLAAMEPHLFAEICAQQQQALRLQESKLATLASVRERFFNCATVPKLIQALVRSMLLFDPHVQAAFAQFSGRKSADRCHALCHRDAHKEERLRLRFKQFTPDTAQQQQAALGVSAISIPLRMQQNSYGVLQLWRDDGAHEPTIDDPWLQEVVMLACSTIDTLWLREEAARCATMQKNFLTVASHELRTPLTALSLQLDSMARMLRRDDQAGVLAPLKQKLVRAFKQTARLTQLIDNLLDVVALRQGNLKVVTTLVQVQDFLDGFLPRWSREAERAGCALSMRCPDPVSGMWDSYRMSQVFDHLLGNAIRYGAGKPIDMFVEQTADDIVLTFKDCGIGVPAQVAEHIFNAFERAVCPKEFGGLGLGLYLSRSIVEAHGGRMRLSHTGVMGSAFSIILPKAAADAFAS